MGATETLWVGELPRCQMCAALNVENDALYDARTNNGRWAFVCERHFERNCSGLGVGKGQRLVTDEGQLKEVRVSKGVQRARDSVAQHQALQAHVEMVGLKAQVAEQLGELMAYVDLLADGGQVNQLEAVCKRLVLLNAALRAVADVLSAAPERVAMLIGMV